MKLSYKKRTNLVDLYEKKVLYLETTDDWSNKILNIERMYLN